MNLNRREKIECLKKLDYREGTEFDQISEAKEKCDKPAIITLDILTRSEEILEKYLHENAIRFERTNQYISYKKENFQNEYNGELILRFLKKYKMFASATLKEIKKYKNISGYYNKQWST